MFGFTSKIIKCFLLFLFGVAITITLSTIFGALGTIISFLPFIWDVLWRTVIVLICLTFVTVLWEGLK